MCEKTDCNTDCPLKNSIYVKPYFPDEKQINVLFVGESPGKTETITGYPFTGSAGKMLYSLMQNAGLNKRFLPITNAVKCEPFGKKPDDDMINFCFENLYNDIHFIKPDLIIALGDVAFRALCNIDIKILNVHGSFYDLHEKFNYNCHVMVTMHPSFVLRQRQWIKVAVMDLQKVNDYIIYGLPNEQQNFNFIHEPSYDTIMAFVDKNKNKNTIIAFDTETTGLDFVNDKVIGISFSDGQTTMALMFTENDNRLQAIEHLLNSDIPKCAQNVTYDFKLLKNTFGFDVKNVVYDTRLGELLLDPETPTNLDFLRSMYTNIQPYKPSGQQMKTISKTWTVEQVNEYACYDAITTFKVMEKQKNYLFDKQIKMIKDHLVPSVKAINYMELNGIRISERNIATAFIESEPKLNELKDHIETTYNINPGSPQQVKKFLNQKDAQEKTLSKLVDRGHKHSELIEKILQYKKLQKFIGTYLQGFWTRSKNINNTYRIFPEYNIVRTGRLAANNPNIQNIPYNFRNIIIADKDINDIKNQKYLIAGDFKQMEVWIYGIVASMYSNSKSLLKSLQSGKDFHDLNSEILHQYVKTIVDKDKNINSDEHYNKRFRTIVKSAGFAVLYYGSKYSLARTTGAPEHICQKMIDEIKMTYPEIVDYHNHILDMVKTKGYVITPYNRIRYTDSVNVGINTPIQATANDVMLSNLIELLINNLDIYMTIHDEIIIQSNEYNFTENKNKFHNIMTRKIPELDNATFKIDLSYGRDYKNLVDL